MVKKEKEGEVVLMTKKMIGLDLLILIQSCCGYQVQKDTAVTGVEGSGSREWAIFKN